MKECTLECATPGCGLSLTATYDDDDDPTVAGLLAGAVSAHEAEHPGHETAIYEEHEDDGTLWRLASRETALARHERSAQRLLERSDARSAERRRQLEELGFGADINSAEPAT